MTQEIEDWEWHENRELESKVAKFSTMAQYPTTALLTLSIIYNSYRNFDSSRKPASRIALFLYLLLLKNFPSSSLYAKMHHHTKLHLSHVKHAVLDEKGAVRNQSYNTSTC